MNKYDFHKLFDPMTFQDFSRDMIQIRDNIFFESFKEGKDQGIDGRYYDDSNTVILQVKRYDRSFSALKSYLKIDEVPKVKKMNPTKYILVISMNFSPKQKDEIKELFFPYIKNTRDIVSSDDLNNLLNFPEYRGVIDNYPTLLFSSTKELFATLDNVVYKTQNSYSLHILDEIQKNAQIYVSTNIYKEALLRLETSNIIFISGEAGMGKTSMAYMLSYELLLKNKQANFAWVRSVDDIYSNLDKEKFKILIWDDFLGSIFYDKQKNVLEQSLVGILKKILQQDNIKLIFTTREYILQQGLYEHSTLKELIEKNKLQCILKEYSSAERARIFLSHIKNAQLEFNYKRQLWLNCEHIVYDENYNPRIIDMFLGKEVDVEKTTPREYSEQLLMFLKHPSEFWNEIYQNISEESKIIALVLLISYTPINVEDLKDSYAKYLVYFSNGMDAKSFSDCINELEKTIIKTYVERGNDTVYVEFQNPSVKEFLFNKVRKTPDKIIQILLDVAVYYNQILYIIEHFSTYCLKETLENVEVKSIECLESLPMKLADYGEIDIYPKEIDFTEEDTVFSRIFHLLSLCSRKEYPELIQFIEVYLVRYTEKMKEEDFVDTYFNLLHYPEAILKGSLAGMTFNGAEIINNYFRQIYTINHYESLECLKRAFPEEYARCEEKIATYIQENIYSIVMDSLEFFYFNNMEIQLDMFEYYISSFLKEYNIEYHETLKEEVAEYFSYEQQDNGKKEFNKTYRKHKKDVEDFEKVRGEGWNYFFDSENTFLEDEEIIKYIDLSDLSVERKKYWKDTIDKQYPWIIYKLLKIDTMIPLLFDLSEEELIKADIFSHVLESIGNSDCYQIKKIIVFCVELCNYILKVDSLTGASIILCK